MPAIQPERLKVEVAELGKSFAQPARFLNRLRELLERYADRTRRSGQSGAPAPLVPTFNTPAPVMRRISREMLTRVQQQPDLGLEVASQLWPEETLEIRQLAARLLAMSCPYAGPEALETLDRWAVPELDKDLLDILFQEAAAPVYLHMPDGYLELTSRYLDAAGSAQRAVGLLALRPLADDPDFENLPVIFNQVGPVIAEVTPSLRPALLELLQSLAARAPEETAFFLRQIQLSQDSREPAWFLRQLKPYFPPALRRSLRDLHA
jgi:hypothetical protein